MSNDPINPGEGWRILKPEDKPNLGDEIAVGGMWLKHPLVFPEVGQSIVRRRIERTQEQKDNQAFEDYYAVSEGGMRGCWFAALAYARKGFTEAPDMGKLQAELDRESKSKAQWHDRKKP